jgi:aminobenzoyl-glutamate utilization protein B
MTKSDLNLLVESIENDRAQWILSSDSIWELAELRFQERESSQILQERMRKAGFEIEKGVAGLETAFIASFGRGGPVIGILGEYDALPGLSQTAGVAERLPLVENGCGHGCGHNLLGAAAAAAAVAVAGFLRDRGLPGTVRFYGCPAEEGGGGKVIMAGAGLFSDLAAAITWHPSDAHYVQIGSTLATRTVTFHFKGRSAHASFNPHDGRSALDAVELMNVGCNYLREHIPVSARLHYAVTNAGGHAPNVVQPEASVKYQMRAPLAREVEEVYQRVCDVARGAALMTQTTFEIDENTKYLNVLPNRTLEELMQSQAESLEFPEVTSEEMDFAQSIRKTFSEAELGRLEVPDIRGEDLCTRVAPLQSGPAILNASTDVGDVSWVTPTVQYRSAVWAVGTTPHTWQASAQGKSSFAHKGMLHAAKVMAATAAALYENPELAQKARAELDSLLQG